jgi:hypothetical protein
MQVTSDEVSVSLDVDQAFVDSEEVEMSFFSRLAKARFRA